MVNCRAFDTWPFVESKTVTLALPATETSFAVTEAVRLVEFVTLVGRALPFHRTTVRPALNPLPVT